MKKFKTKGFTLAETIVAILIIAILCAMFIPNLTGYIRRSHQTEAIMECRGTVIAAQTILNQTYAYKTADFQVMYNGTEYSLTTSVNDTQGALNLTSFHGTDETLNNVICGLADSHGTINNIQTNSFCQLMTLSYTSENGIEVEYSYTNEEGYMVMED